MQFADGALDRIKKFVPFAVIKTDEIDADLGVHLSQCDLVTVDNYSMEVNWLAGAECFCPTFVQNCLALDRYG